MNGLEATPLSCRNERLDRFFVAGQRFEVILDYVLPAFPETHAIPVFTPVKLGVVVDAPQTRRAPRSLTAPSDTLARSAG